MISRSGIRALARVALAALLFAQAAVVLAACEWARRAPTLALALAEREIGGGACHEQGRNANLCLAHCLGEDQSLDKPLVKVAALSEATILFVPRPLVSLHDARAPRRANVPPATSPPFRILFQSLLI